MIFYEMRSGKIAVELTNVITDIWEWTLFLEFYYKEIYFEHYAHFVTKRITTDVPESIQQKFKEYMENPFFEIDKRKYMIENNLIELPKDVEEI